MPRTSQSLRFKSHLVFQSTWCKCNQTKWYGDGNERFQRLIKQLIGYQKQIKSFAIQSGDKITIALITPIHDIYLKSYFNWFQRNFSPYIYLPVNRHTFFQTFIVSSDFFATKTIGKRLD